MLRRVYGSSLNAGQWRKKCEVDSISKPQLQIGFKQSWKLCLNLRSCKWLIPTHSRVISLISLWLLQLKLLLGEGLINFRILFLKTTKLFEFRRVGSKFFYSMIVEGKKEFLKKLCLISKYNHENTVPSRLSPQWLCGKLMHFGTWCTVIYCWYQCTLFSWLYICYAHLASVKFEHSVCCGSLMTTYITLLT